MTTNNEQGRMYALGVGIYCIIKSVLNMILGGGFGDIIVAVVIGAVLYTGLQYMNYVTAGYLAFIVLINFPHNVTHIDDCWIYLLEGAIDLGCAALLVLNSDVKEHFTFEWQDVPDLFRK